MASHLNQRLSEEYVQDCFHSYLKSSLTQAKAEKLLDTDMLSSAEGDLMITGPALCLYFAALRCTTSPPSVPLPRRDKTRAPTDLSETNCPPAFLSFLRVWGNTVMPIQDLIPEDQHDLARVICGLPPVAERANPALGGIAADLRAVAIEISQRRTFQDRYAADLQAAIDASVGGSNLHVTASFVPPPVYNPSPEPSPRPSPPRINMPSPTPSPTFPQPESPSVYLHGSRTHGGGRSPSTFTDSIRAMEFIRETLYAALADAFERSPSLRLLLRTDPPRAYFASVAFAILDVATGSITPHGSVIGVLGQELTIKQCPVELKPFMLELAAIGLAAKESEEEDDKEAIERVSAGKRPHEPRMERVKKVLEQGVGYDMHRRTDRTHRRPSDESERSTKGRAVAFANRINALALSLTKLKTFRDRQKEVFDVLAGIGV